MAKISAMVGMAIGTVMHLITLNFSRSKGHLTGREIVKL